MQPEPSNVDLSDQTVSKSLHRGWDSLIDARLQLFFRHRTQGKELLQLVPPARATHVPHSVSVSPCEQWTRVLPGTKQTHPLSKRNSDSPPSPFRTVQQRPRAQHDSERDTSTPHQRQTQISPSQRHPEVDHSRTCRASQTGWSPSSPAEVETETPISPLEQFNIPVSVYLCEGMRACANKEVCARVCRGVSMCECEYVYTQVCVCVYRCV